MHRVSAEILFHNKSVAINSHVNIYIISLTYRGLYYNIVVTAGGKGSERGCVCLFVCVCMCVCAHPRVCGGTCIIVLSVFMFAYP